MKGRSLLKRFLRRHRGKLSQAALARKVGVSPASVSLWLSNPHHVPSLDNALALERETGGAVPAVSWSNSHTQSTLTFRAGEERPSGVLNERDPAVSLSNSTRRPAAGGAK